jgi:hypothetical protein
LIFQFITKASNWRNICYNAVKIIINEELVWRE